MTCDTYKPLRHWYGPLRQMSCISLLLCGLMLWLVFQWSSVLRNWLSTHAGIEGNPRQVSTAREEFERASPVAERSVTAILPVTVDSLPRLTETLLPFFQLPAHRLRYVVLHTPDSLIPSTRQAVEEIVQSHGAVPRPEFILTSWALGLGIPGDLLHAAAHAETNWTLVMDERGLTSLDRQTKHQLLNPLAIPVPVGPRGVSTSGSQRACLPHSTRPQFATFLQPPFVSPTELLESAVRANADTWEKVGNYVAQLRGDGVGGIVAGRIFQQKDWCLTLTTTFHFATDNGLLDLSRSHFYEVNNTVPTTSSTLTPKGSFAVLLPNTQDLMSFAPVACRLIRDGHSVHILISKVSLRPRSPFIHNAMWSQRHLSGPPCRLPYHILIDSSGRSVDTDLRVFDWFGSLEDSIDIVITRTDARYAHEQLMARDSTNFTHIRIPPSDLPYCAWMGSLKLQEWRSWHKPRIDVSVITKDRPQSLARLLTSLRRAKFYGDKLDVRIMIEQPTERNTLRIIDSWNWTLGSVFVHRRVVHAGLLPAVVESWYPHGNDTYGLLLEDDVELSPMFYAWVKMAVLKYRYGDASDKSPLLFGISLYQQKNLELRLEGRQAFNPRALFHAAKISNPVTPYLSPVPCSWGAVYFPEHWREFHDYLGNLFSNTKTKTYGVVVPGVRSNYWTKSWKRYFIELVYLRGYVMLYPNYPDFVSLSTNHLELGSHVKSTPKEKQALFTLPLMPLPNVPEQECSGLLELPEGTLPPWSQLPVINLTGSLSTLDTLLEQGEKRQKELMECTEAATIQ
ncbi:hypothetical protein AX16_010408 [Volvariella volvacea WC 439]|nr:hypothetical protein AX16_010408 [Volvariella volvacea WC 439]